jgi:feruloyl esterase
MKLLRVFLHALVALATAQNIVSDPKSRCSHIANSFDYPHVKVNFAQYISAGTNLSLEQNAVLETCDRPYQLVPVDLCRVAMFVKTSATSNITLEAWLPTNWTGRFLSTGNGGLSGCIQYEDIAYGTSFGFATVGANNGHNGTSGEAFYKAPEVVADFAYRSVHTGVVVGKQISKAYYESDYTKSYYLGCSTGGRQGFKEVQDFPNDFDGVVVGAPALAFNNLSSWSGSFYLYTGSNTSSTFLSPDEWALVHEDILSQCDTIDGVKDGIIEGSRALRLHTCDATMLSQPHERLCLSQRGQSRNRKESLPTILGLGRRQPNRSHLPAHAARKRDSRRLHILQRPTIPIH